MKTKVLKKILLSTASIFVLLVFVLGIHIYMVTKPRVDAKTIVMARIDVKQDINPTDVSKITAWLSEQKGVSEVKVNPKSDMVIFTFYPIITNGNTVADNFKSYFHYANAVRFMPSEADLKGGCPMASNSFPIRIYSYFKSI